MLVFGKLERNPKCVTKTSVSLVLDHPSLSESGTKDYQSFDVPLGKGKEFLQTEDGYRITIWNPGMEMH